MKENGKEEEIGKRKKEETAKGKYPRTFLKVEAIMWKGGEFKKSGRKKWKKKKKKKRGEVQKKEVVEEVHKNEEMQREGKQKK